MKIKVPKQKRFTKKHSLIAAGIIALAVIVGVGLIWHAYKPAKTITPTVVQPKTEQQAGTPVTSKPVTTTTPSQNSTIQDPTSDNSTNTLPPPTGQVINIHSTSLSSTSGQNSSNLISTCQTTNQATCVVQISGAKTFTLQPTSGDGNGQFSFEWNAGKVGLTPGDWNVELIAQSGGVTSTSGVEVLHVSN